MYHRESRSVYFTLAFAGIALMAAAVVGVAVFKRRSASSPHSQVYHVKRHVNAAIFAVFYAIINRYAVIVYNTLISDPNACIELKKSNAL